MNAASSALSCSFGEGGTTTWLLLDTGACSGMGASAAADDMVMDMGCEVRVKVK